MKSGYTHIAIVLDRSGSMQSCIADTIGGFNAFIEEQKKVPGEATLTLVQFDDAYEWVQAGLPLKDIPALKFEPRGSTALLDAIGKTINDQGLWLSVKHEHDRPEKVIFVIITDGHENASREFTRDKIFQLIRQQESQYQWQFVFIGANQDAIAAGAQIGVYSDSALTYDARRPRAAFAALASSVRAVRSGAMARASFTADDRKRNKPRS